MRKVCFRLNPGVRNDGCNVVILLTADNSFLFLRRKKKSSRPKDLFI